MRIYQAKAQLDPGLTLPRININWPKGSIMLRTQDEDMLGRGIVG